QERPNNAPATPAVKGQSMEPTLCWSWTHICAEPTVAGKTSPAHNRVARRLPGRFVSSHRGIVAPPKDQGLPPPQADVQVSVPAGLWPSSPQSRGTFFLSSPPRSRWGRALFPGRFHLIDPTVRG